MSTLPCLAAESSGGRGAAPGRTALFFWLFVATTLLVSIGRLRPCDADPSKTDSLWTNQHMSFLPNSCVNQGVVSLVLKICDFHILTQEGEKQNDKKEFEGFFAV